MRTRGRLIAMLLADAVPAEVRADRVGRVDGGGAISISAAAHPRARHVVSPRIGFSETLFEPEVSTACRAAAAPFAGSCDREGACQIVRARLAECRAVYFLVTRTAAACLHRSTARRSVRGATALLDVCPAHRRQAALTDRRPDAQPAGTAGRDHRRPQSAVRQSTRATRSIQQSCRSSSGIQLGTAIVISESRRPRSSAPQACDQPPRRVRGAPRTLRAEIARHCDEVIVSTMRRSTRTTARAWAACSLFLPVRANGALSPCCTTSWRSSPVFRARRTSWCSAYPAAMWFPVSGSRAISAAAACSINVDGVESLLTRQAHYGSATAEFDALSQRFAHGVVYEQRGALLPWSAPATQKAVEIAYPAITCRAPAPSASRARRSLSHRGREQRQEAAAAGRAASSRALHRRRMGAQRLGPLPLRRATPGDPRLELLDPVCTIDRALAALRSARTISTYSVGGLYRWSVAFHPSRTCCYFDVPSPPRATAGDCARYFHCHQTELASLLVATRARRQGAARDYRRARYAPVAHRRQLSRRDARQAVEPRAGHAPAPYAIHADLSAPTATTARRTATAGAACTRG